MIITTHGIISWVLYFIKCRGRESDSRRKDFPCFFLELLQGSDYIITPKGVGRFLEDYCWDSLPSLYTFQDILTHLGLARDYPLTGGFPRIHPIFNPILL
ncbi:MAG: hypothetical protein UT86_C0002G0161 [Candidatus Magasanikbacteria bacterium GW2011_GWC2_40_17]|uniref:Uncharacterized protein n=1 Tax=Candidatus Magasanikbacteria bacterium GW2011_GWA2_42_32 TaxID=1619039 RepID=A0A0G1A8E7_9BACT|nr:MAG: hypothetical protein UT86_C0002G0161 [Candidatus Magasanikbacteria bacterium GW2011_GWC2_40_17]KKS57322.1 MAG: hypothetical protein UV20_C0002G0111 [Candidatus Magasanikbacteria bacterium GW2011_GWA2_42_32]